MHLTTPTGRCITSLLRSKDRIRRHHSIRHPLTSDGKAQRGIYHFDERVQGDRDRGRHEIHSNLRPFRIRRHRMSRFAITFKDSHEWPIDYGSVKLELKRHSFPFGVSLRTRRESSMQSTDYVWYLNAAAKHFWSGTIAEQMQWYEYEPAPATWPARSEKSPSSCSG